MSKTANLQPYQDERGRWRLSIPPSISATGKRRRPVFRNRDEAQDVADEIAKSLAEAETLIARTGPEMIKQAIHFHEIFQFYGFAGLQDGCQAFIDQMETEQRGKTMRAVLDAMEADQGSTWSKGVKESQDKYRGFLEHLEERSAGTVTPEEWRDWLLSQSKLRDYAPGSHNHLHAWVSKVYNYAVRRGFVKTNPLLVVEKAKIPKGAICIHTNDEVSRLMLTAWERDREMVPYFALAEFAGLRTTAEIEREESGARWEHISFDEDWIRVDSTKTGLRFVPLEPTCRAWLLPFRQSSGLIRPQGFQKRRRAIVRAANVRWGQEYRDIARHTYGSNLDGKYRDADIVRDAMGHTNYKTFLKHYKNARTPKDALEFWAIGPGCC